MTHMPEGMIALGIHLGTKLDPLRGSITDESMWFISTFVDFYDNPLQRQHMIGVRGESEAKQPACTSYSLLLKQVM